MGRHKQYDRDDIARKAMVVFWRHGFDGTSTQMLVDEMGVNRFSLYAEFGNKQALYEAALEVYYSEVVERNLALLEAPNAGLEAVVHLLQSMCDWSSDRSSEVGCFMCNAAIERASIDPNSRDFVHRYVERLGRGFAQCLETAKAQKLLLSEVDALQEGRFLAALFLGLLVQLRAQVPAAVVQAAGDGALAYLRRLTVAGTWPVSQVALDGH